MLLHKRKRFMLRFFYVLFTSKGKAHTWQKGNIVVRGQLMLWCESHISQENNERYEIFALSFDRVSRSLCRIENQFFVLFFAWKRASSKVKSIEILKNVILLHNILLKASSIVVAVKLFLFLHFFKIPKGHHNKASLFSHFFYSTQFIACAIYFDISWEEQATECIKYFFLLLCACLMCSA